MSYDNGHGGTPAPQVFLPDNERVSTLHFVFGFTETAHIHRLEITFANGSSITIPTDWQGREDEQHAWWSPAENQMGIGLAGMSRGWIKSLAPIYAEFLPATWKQPDALLQSALALEAVAV